MKNTFSKKDTSALLKIFSGICGNMAAGWFGFILIAAGFVWPHNLTDWLNLTRSVGFGILFMYLAYFFERRL